MAAPRNVAPTPNIAPFIAVAAIALGIGAALLRLPGGIVIWALLLVAAWMSTGPQLTGKKDAAGYPTIGNPGEGRKMLQHRLWLALRWKLIISGDWLLNDSGELTRRLQKATTPVQKSAALFTWCLLPTSLTTWIGVGVAAAVFTFPVDRLAMLGAAPDTAGWLMWPNAICSYIVVVQIAASRRRFAAADDPQPAITVSHLIAALTSRGTHQLVAPAVGAVVFVGAGALTTVALNGFEVAWLIHPWQVTAAGAGIAAAGLTLRQLALPHAWVNWQQTVAAREVWNSRWLTLKVDPGPYLIEHREHDVEGQLPVLADTFEAPATHGAEGIIAMLPKLSPAVGGGYHVMALNENDFDSQRQPVPGSKSPIRVTIVAWPTDSTLDPLTPDVDQEAFELMLRAAAANAAPDSGWPQPMLLGISMISEPADGNPAAWQVSFAGSGDMDAILGSTAAHIHHLFGVEAIADPAEGVVYVGALTDGSTDFVDPGVLARLIELDREVAWRRRWTDVLKQGEQKPYIQHPVYAERELATGEPIFTQPFMTPQGIQIDTYMNESKEKSLASTLANAPFVSIQRWDTRGARAGERHPGAFRVIWSPEAIVANPAAVKPGDQRSGTAEPTTWVIAASVMAGFDAAKLTRPEVVTAKALTSRSSERHIWEIQLRLYGSVTLATVKQQVEKIRNGMGAVEWIRVTSAEDGCRIVAGASPQHPAVVFSRRANKDLCVALDWEQAWTDAKVITGAGAVPTLVSSEPLPRNKKVTQFVFRLPPGIDRQKIRDAKKTLMPATGNVYLEDEAGPTPDTVTIIACPEQPVPFPAPFDWSAVEESTAIPFASGVTGEPIEWDWTLDPHLILLGGSGSGKSASLQNLITGALIRGADVFVADPTKGAADFQFAAPWMRAVAVTDGEASAMMDHIYAEVRRRVTVNSQYGVGSYRDLPADARPPHMVVIIDEFTSLMFTETPQKLPANASEEELRLHQEQELSNTNRRNVGGKAGRLVREARSAGISLVLAAQELKSDTIQKIPGGTSLKGNSSSLLLGKTSFGTRMSALKDAVAAPELGDQVPRGRGLFESTAVGAQVIQSWYDMPDHVSSMTEHIAAVRQLLADDERVPLAAMVRTVEDGPVFGRRIDGLGAVVADDDVVDVSWDGGEIDLGLVEVDFNGMFDAEPAEPLASAEDLRAPAQLVLVGPGVSEDVEVPAESVDVEMLAPAEMEISGDPLTDVLVQWMLAHSDARDVVWMSPAAFDLVDGTPRHELLEQTSAMFGLGPVTPMRPVSDAADEIDVGPGVLGPPADAELMFGVPEAVEPASTRDSAVGAPPGMPLVAVPPPPQFDEDDLFGSPRAVVAADDFF